MESQRKRQRQLRQHLQRSRPGRKRRGQRGALKVPARQRRDQVRGAEDVEETRQRAARDAVQRAAVPGYLRPVDAEVRGDGAVEALACEDLGGRFGGRDAGCFDESVGRTGLVLVMGRASRVLAFGHGGN